MKKLLILIFLFASLAVNATVYYVSTAGNDGNNGLTTSTTWATITKVNTVWNAGTFNPGDQILFNKGDTFNGTITVKESGTVGNPITVGAYGTGANPIITGFTTISGWTNYGGGIYSKVISSASAINMVTVNEVQYGMGRFPKTIYNTYESFNAAISITDNQLTASPNWTGAEAVIRKNDWTADRCIITNHSGTTLTYTSRGTSQVPYSVGFGYFSKIVYSV